MKWRIHAKAFTTGVVGNNTTKVKIVPYINGTDLLNKMAIQSPEGTKE